MTLARLREWSSRHPLALLLLAGMGLRVVLAYVLLPGEGLAGDLRYYGSWMLILGDGGPANFYAATAHHGASLPPGLPWVLWPLGVAAKLLAGLTGVRPDAAALLLVKVPAIVADGWLAVLLHRLAGRWSGEKAGLLAAGLFLFVPGTWYESALWGQVDSVASLPALAAIALLIGGWSEAAVVAVVVAILIKPQFITVAFVIGVVLLRRHLLVRGSGPRPELQGRLARFDDRLGGWFTREQGWGRLVSSAFAAVAITLVLVVPFDMEVWAPATLAGIPVVGDLAGLAELAKATAAFFTPLTANAYNPWVLVGPHPLYSDFGHWTFDSIRLIDGIRAFGIGAAILGVALALAGVRLLHREDRARILLVSTFLVVAFFILPTRVHERYAYFALVAAAPLAATSVAWRAWYVVLGLANIVNLHAVLTFGGTAAMQGLPFADATRDPRWILLVVAANTALFGWVTWQVLSARSPAYPSPETRLGGGHP